MLAALEGFAAATLGRLDRSSLTTVVADLGSFSQTVYSRADLSAVLSDTSISNVARGGIVGDLLNEKVSTACSRLCVYAASSVPAPEVPHAYDELAHVARTLLDTGEFHHANLGLLDARRRVAGFADATLEGLDTDSFAAIEDDLFRWARTVEANVELRRLLQDRDAPVTSRLGLTTQLLEGKVAAASLALAQFCVVGGRARDVVGTLDYLVNYVARSRDWRVARVHSARPLDDASQLELTGALRSLTGRNVELRIVEEPALLGGVLVEIGDLRLDATTRGRLGALRDAVASGRVLESAVK